MKIGIIGGTGGIAAKAYLPVYAALQEQHEFTIYSRELAKAENIRAKYNFAKATQVLANLDKSDLVFIHAATEVHFELVKHFLNAGVHVVLDKPVSEDLAEVENLLNLAKSQNLLFIVAFNRRFLPAIEPLKTLPDKSFVNVVKNVAARGTGLKYDLYDMFIHPLDTLIYLLDDFDMKTAKIETDLVELDQQLQRVQVTVKTPQSNGIARMNLTAGAFQEEFTVESPTGTRRLSDLADLVTFDELDIKTGHFHGWAPITYVRGFDNVVHGAIDAVSKFNRTNRDKLLQGLHQDNILASHQIIAKILER